MRFRFPRGSPLELVIDMEINAENVRIIREKYGLSILDAKQFIILQKSKKEIENLISNGSTEEKINFILENIKKEIDDKLKTKFRNLLDID